MSTTPHPGVPPSDIQSPEAPKSKRPSWLLRIGITIVVLVGGISVLLILGKVRESAYRAKCRSNLSAIGMVIMLYTQDHAGRYPDSLVTVAREE